MGAGNISHSPLPPPHSARLFHHRFRSADQRDGGVQFGHDVIEQALDVTGRAAPIAVGLAEHLAQLDALLPPFGRHLSLEAEIVHRARPVKHHEASVVFARTRQMAQRRTQRREADPHGHEDQVMAFVIFDREAAADNVF